MCCVLADVGRERLGLGMASYLFRGGAAGSGVGDREVFSGSETGVASVLDGLDDPALGGTDGSGAFPSDLAGLAKLVGFAAHDREVRVGSGA